MTKDEARRSGGKADDGTDWCEKLGWYGDGVCDDFCPAPDPDCSDCPLTGVVCTPDCGDDGRLPGGAPCQKGTFDPATCECVPDAIQLCGGMLGLVCDDGEYCHYTLEEMCGAADHTGECRPRPEACMQLWQPVCGCDARTYGNECDANAAGVSVAHEGECEFVCHSNDECPQPMCLPGGPCPTMICVDGQCVPDEGPVECREDGDCPQLVCIPEMPCPQTRCIDGECRTDEIPGGCGGFMGLVCAADEYCDYEEGQLCGAADQLGTCQPRPEACTQEYDPVCGCDGETYGNACSANSAGVDVASYGECAPSDCRDQGCGDGDYCSYCWGSWQCIPEGAIC